LEFIVMDATKEAQQTETAETQAVNKADVKDASPAVPAGPVQEDNLSDEARLAAEALAATEDPAEESPEIAGLKKEDERLIGSITAKRQLLRELDRKFDEKLAAEKAAVPPEKSPEEKYIEANEDTFDPDTEPFPARVQIAQRKWEKEQAEKSRRLQEESSISASANKSYLKARETYGDFDEIVLGAEDLLTEGDQIDVKNAAKKGEDPAEKLYRICIYKTLLAGGDRAKQLRANLKAKIPSKKASVQEPINQQETGGSEQAGAKKTAPKPAEPPASAEEAISSPQLAHIYSAFGLD
jgi:hypothetical protein